MVAIGSYGSNEYSYKLEKSKDGIFVENFDNSCTDDNRFTQNNTVYVENNIYTFNYIHLSGVGDSLLFDIEFGTQNWEFCPTQNKSDITVSIVQMKVMHGREPFAEIYPDYDQTIIRYYYLNGRDNNFLQQSRTGVIDNEQNIWIHPPRVGYFKILELNPLYSNSV